MPDSIEIYLGVDVSKDVVDVCALSVRGRVLFQDRVPRSAAAIRALAARLESPAVAVMEGTGRLEALPAKAFEAAGVGVVIVNPATMRHFALGHGMLEKSDRLDARIIAEFGRERRPAPRVVPDPALEMLAQLTARRRQLVRLRAAEKTRLRAETLAFNRASLVRMIDCLSEQIEQIKLEILRQIRASAELQARFDLLLSAPGVGETTAAQLLASLPECGKLSRGALAKLVGVAPLVKQSGRWRGRVMTQGGRSSVRSALYMATLSAVRWDAYFRERYQRLVDRGKPKKVALIAMARQLLVVLNQMLRCRRSFDPALLSNSAS